MEVVEPDCVDDAAEKYTSNLMEYCEEFAE